MAFVKATKKQAKLRMAISGPSGSGKTFTALRVAGGIGKKIAVIDSEFGSASKYADQFSFDCNDISANKHPNEYIKAIKEAESLGYDVVIIDSITHAWDETKNVVDKVAAASRNPNTYVAWKEGTKVWDSLKTAINACKIHVIVTMRAKTEYVLEEVNGKKVPTKKGMAPEVRDGTEYEFDVVLDMTHEHYGNVTKTRCSSVDGYVEHKPGEQLGATLLAWLSDGATDSTHPNANATPKEGVDALKNAPAGSDKGEATEEHREQFVNYLQTAFAAIGDAVREVVEGHGYSSIGEVHPKDFRQIMRAVKELMPKK